MVTGIETEHPRLAKEWLFLPAFALLGIIVMIHRGRAAAAAAAAAPISAGA
jgi:hypothetical protein